MEHWYVYYKVAAVEADTVARQVRQMFNLLGERAPNARLMRRADMEGDEVTLMEVYEPVSDASTFGATLDGAVRASGLASALVARRRVERFRDL